MRATLILYLLIVPSLECFWIASVHELNGSNTYTKHEHSIENPMQVQRSTFVHYLSLSSVNLNTTHTNIFVFRMYAGKKRWERPTSNIGTPLSNAGPQTWMPHNAYYEPEHQYVCGRQQLSRTVVVQYSVPKGFVRKNQV